MDFSSINWLALIVATLSAYALGAIWYSPILFGKAWQKGVGLSEEDIKGANMAKIFGTTFLLTFIIGLGLALMIGMHPSPMTWMEGLHQGLFVGVFFVSASMAINYLYQRKSLKLWLIDAGYQIVFIAIMATILAVWP